MASAPGHGRGEDGFVTVTCAAVPLRTEPTGRWCWQCNTPSGCLTVFAVEIAGGAPIGVSTVHGCADCGLVIPQRFE